MEFSRQEYWSGLPFPSPGDLPDPGSNPGLLSLQTYSLPSEPPGKCTAEERQGYKYVLNGCVKDITSCLACLF